MTSTAPLTTQIAWTPEMDALIKANVLPDGSKFRSYSAVGRAVGVSKYTVRLRTIALCPHVVHATVEHVGRRNHILVRKELRGKKVLKKICLSCRKPFVTRHRYTFMCDEWNCTRYRRSVDLGTDPVVNFGAGR